MNSLEDAWTWLAGLATPASNRTVRNEALDQEWIELRVLWSACRPSGAASADITAIDELLKPLDGGLAKGWAMLNEAQLRISRYMTAEQLKVGFARLLAIATLRSLPTLAAHEANQALFDDATKISEQREAYAQLLGDVQAISVRTRFQRRLRSETAGRLFRYGVVALLVALAVPLAMVWDRVGPVGFVKVEPNAVSVTMMRFSNEPGWSLAMVASFGLLGAYFSRIMTFQSHIASVTFDEVLQAYIGRTLRMRLLYGTIGAIIFYMFLRSGLVGGDMFPHLDRIGIAEQHIWRFGARGVEQDANAKALLPSGLTVLAPTVDLAKLLVWSFIAGFSERLVPDTIGRVENEAGNQRPS